MGYSGDLCDLVSILIATSDAGKYLFRQHKTSSDHF